MGASREGGDGWERNKTSLRSFLNSILHLALRGIFLFVKGQRRLVFNPDVIFSCSYLPCQVLGLNFSNPWCLGFGSRFPPPLQAHSSFFGRGRVCSLAPARFPTGAPGGSCRAGGPYLPGLAPSRRQPAGLRQREHNEQSWPRLRSAAREKHQAFPQ